jgi:NADP-dependent aldehyde dehydrogenase
MGSVNPVFLLPAALKERGGAIAEGLKGSVTLGNGQFCTKPGVVASLGGADFDAFVSKLGLLMSQQAPGTLLHPGIQKSYEDGLKSLGSVAGARCVARAAVPADRSKTQVDAAVFATDAATFLGERRLREEVFGPVVLAVSCGSRAELEAVARSMDGHLTATIQGTEADLREHAVLAALLEERVGRVVFNGFPTGVEVCQAMQHGGPWPSSSDGRFTSVGTAGIARWARPVCYQGFPDAALPPELQNRNERRLWRLVDGRRTQEDLA